MNRLSCAEAEPVAKKHDVSSIPSELSKRINHREAICVPTEKAPGFRLIRTVTMTKTSQAGAEVTAGSRQVAKFLRPHGPRSVAATNQSLFPSGHSRGNDFTRRHCITNWMQEELVSIYLIAAYRVARRIF
jgi:hypothetical protein